MLSLAELIPFRKTVDVLVGAEMNTDVAGIHHPHALISSSPASAWTLRTDQLVRTLVTLEYPVYP
jgi:hypothetical protein